MKRLFLNISALLAVSSALVLTSCKDDDGSAANPIRAFVNNGTGNEFRSALVHTPNGSFGEVKAEFSVKLTREADADTRITFTVDEAAIAAYNAANETGYLPIPASLLSLGNGALVKRGEMTSAENVSVSVANVAELKEKQYMTVLKIAGISGGNCVASTNQNSVALFVTTSETKFQVLPDNSVPAGLTELSKAGWDVAADGYADPALMIDGGVDDYFYGVSPTILIDMKTIQQVDVIGINPFMSLLAVKDIVVGVSVDGETWDELGELQLPDGHDLSYFRIFSTPCRYIALNPKTTWAEYPITYIAELYFYKNN